MNDIERRFYSEPATRNIPVGHLSTMKDVFQKILSDIKDETSISCRGGGLWGERLFAI